MKIDIKSKLKDCLSISEISERDVVYILVQAGKIIEITGTQINYPSLLFYRNWSVHSAISRQTQFVKELGGRFRDISTSTDIVTNKVFGFVTFTELKNELIRFFHQQVENDLIPSREFLKAFQLSLVPVIADVPISIELGDDTIKITLTKHEVFKIEGPGTYSGSIKIIK